TQTPAIVQAKHEEGPQLGLLPTEGTALIEVNPVEALKLEKVPNGIPVLTHKSEPKGKSLIVPAGFVEQLPTPTAVKKTETGAKADTAPEELAAPAPGLSLDEAIHLALGANPDLLSAAERTNFAAEVLARARADFFPVLSFSQNYAVSD